MNKYCSFKLVLTGLLFTVMMTCFATAQMSLTPDGRSVPLKVPPPDEGGIPKSGHFIHVDLDLMVLKYYIDGQVSMESVCGAGTGIGKSVTPNGPFKITKLDPNHKSNLYDGAPMPWAMRINKDGSAIHGSPGFVALIDEKGQPVGLAQSHGCIRLPVSFAKELYKRVPDGTSGRVDGNIKNGTMRAYKLVASMFEDVPGETDSIRMKIAAPNPSPEVVAQARKMWVEGRLFSSPRGETDIKKRWICYPNMPKSTWIRATEFQDKILTRSEKLSGVHLTFRDFTLPPVAGNSGEK